MQQSICKKIYVDTHFMVPNISDSTADFSIQLPFDITLGPNASCFLDEVCIPYSWYSIETDMNDRIYFRSKIKSYDNRDLIAILSNRTYDGPEFAREVEGAMNPAVSDHQQIFTVVYNEPENTIVIKCGPEQSCYRIFSDWDLAHGTIVWQGQDFDKQSPGELQQGYRKLWRHEIHNRLLS